MTPTVLQVRPFHDFSSIARPITWRLTPRSKETVFRMATWAPRRKWHNWCSLWLIDTTIDEHIRTRYSLIRQWSDSLKVHLSQANRRHAETGKWLSFHDSVELSRIKSSGAHWAHKLKSIPFVPVHFGQVKRHCSDLYRANCQVMRLNFFLLERERWSMVVCDHGNHRASAFLAMAIPGSATPMSRRGWERWHDDTICSVAFVLGPSAWSSTSRFEWLIWSLCDRTDQWYGCGCAK